MFSLFIVFMLCTGAIVQVFKDNENVLQGIYFQTEMWRKTFSDYPELLMIDATYKLNNLRMPLFILMVVDSNGESEVIALWLVATESKSMINQLTETFVSYNDASNTKCIMADKDMTERDLLSEKIPTAQLLICLFHVLRTFRREITCEKMGITAAQRMSVLEIISKLVYSQDQQDYHVYYQQLKETKLKSVIEYYDQNWHDIRSQWVEGLKHDCCHYLNSTNNQLESLNQKIKSVVSKYSSVLTFFQQLMKCLHSLSIERDHRAATTFQKTPVNSFDFCAALFKYQSYLMRYAFSHVHRQYRFAEKVKVLAENLDVKSSTVTFCSKERSIHTSQDNCDCGFFKAKSLPCRHIFALRRYLKADLYNNQLCPLRWTREYFQKSHRVFCPYRYHVPDVTVNTINSLSKILSQQEKYRKVYSIAQKLADIASDISSREFGYAVECLKQIVTAWEQGKRVVVEVVNDDADEGKVFTEDTENLINSNIHNATVIDNTKDHVEDDAYNNDDYEVDENEVFKEGTDSTFNNIHNPFVDVSNNPIVDDIPEIAIETYCLNDHFKNAVGYVVKDNVDDNEAKDITNHNVKNGIEDNAVNNAANYNYELNCIDKVVKDDTDYNVKNTVDNNATVEDDAVKGDAKRDVKNSVDAKNTVDNSVKGEANYDAKNTIDNNVNKSEVLMNIMDENLIQDTGNDRCVDNSINKFVETDQDDDFQKPCSSNTNRMSPIKLPPKVRMKGRPKGAGLTVLGLPRKKKIGDRHPIRFLMQSSGAKEKKILSWILSDDQVKRALNGELIDIEEIPNHTMQLSPCLLDENVNWKVVKKYFTEGAWAMMRCLIHSLSEHPYWDCGVCQEDLGHFNSICCESCLTRYHLECVGLNNPPKRVIGFVDVAMQRLNVLVRRLV